MSFVRLAVLTTTVLALAGCKLGPGNIAPDRFSYTDAIARSNNEQLLANIVRLRYNEPPVFLNVGSVLTQYVYAGRVSVEGAAAAETSAVPGWSVGGGASGTYIERPTITYTPLTGQDFAQQLLAPIDSAAIFSLVQSGWTPDELVRLTIESINRVDGRIRRSTLSPEELARLAEYSEVIDLLLVIARRHALEMHRDANDPAARYLVFADDTDEETAGLVTEFKTALGLDPDLSRFRVTDRDIRGPDEITIRVRSLGAMLSLEARGIDVPAEHLEEHRAVPMSTPYEHPSVASFVRLRVRSSESRPDDAFVAVKHEGYWFSIANSDHQSKKAFGLLGYLFQIQAPASQSVGGPVLTVPTG